MIRAARRHPATAHLEELHRWRARYPTTVKDEEAILAVTAWLRAQAKLPPPSRTPKAAPKPATTPLPGLSIRARRRPASPRPRRLKGRKPATAPTTAA